ELVKAELAAELVVIPWRSRATRGTLPTSRRHRREAAPDHAGVASKQPRRGPDTARRIHGPLRLVAVDGERRPSDRLPRPLRSRHPGDDALAQPPPFLRREPRHDREQQFAHMRVARIEPAL